MAIEANYSVKAETVVAVSIRLKYDRELPQRIHADYGSELISYRTVGRACRSCAKLELGRRGKLLGNTLIECSSCWLPEKRLIAHGFRSIADPKKKGRCLEMGPQRESVRSSSLEFVTPEVREKSAARRWQKLPPPVGQRSGAPRTRLEQASNLDQEKRTGQTCSSASSRKTSSW